MAKIRFVLAGIVLLCSALLGLAGSDTAKKIVGKWQVVKSEDAPPGATIEFTKDNKVTLRASVMGKEHSMNGTYKVDGNKVTVSITVGGQTKSDTNTVKELTDQKMVVSDDKGKTEEYKRVK